MKNTIKTNIKYRIEPRMKQRWFMSDIKVYDLIKEYDLDNGIDDTPNRMEETLYSFDTIAEAENFKREMELFQKSII